MQEFEAKEIFED